MKTKKLLEKLALTWDEVVLTLKGISPTERYTKEYKNILQHKEKNTNNNEGMKVGFAAVFLGITTTEA